MIVDTSAWVEFLRDAGTQVCNTVDALLDEPVGRARCAANSGGEPADALGVREIHDSRVTHSPGDRETYPGQQPAPINTRQGVVVVPADRVPGGGIGGSKT